MKHFGDDVYEQGDNQGYFIKFQFFILGLEPSNKATILTNQKLGKRIKA